MDFLQSYPNSTTIFSVTACHNTKYLTIPYDYIKPNESFTIFENAYFLTKCFEILYKENPEIFSKSQHEINSQDEINRKFEEIWARVRPSP